MNHPPPDPNKAVELVLRSIFRSQPPETTIGGGFHISRPHSGEEIHFEASGLLEAALFIRRNAGVHLRSLSVGDLQNMLTRFISDQIGICHESWWLLPKSVPLSDSISVEAKADLIRAMVLSPIFTPPEVLFLYPIKIVEVDASYHSQAFFLVSPDDLPKELLRWYDPKNIQSDRHPPTPMHDGMPRTKTSCWLGVRSPNAEIALRTRNAIIGALSLLPHPLERYTFSMGTVPTGYMSFEKRVSYHSGEASTPSLSEKLLISAVDHEWLEMLSRKLSSSIKSDRKDILSLQYFYRAWVRDPAARVAPLCGALDALFGDRDTATQAMVDAVGTRLGAEFDAARVRHLAKLRAGVIHGGAPNIYEASIYHRYYVDYRRDPIRDLELVTARCLQRQIFGGVLMERPHTYANLIKQYTGATV